jgi:hypothetical protein
VRHFTACIALDGSNHVYFSNRSAAHAALADWGAAAADAARTTALKPDWAKGWARRGAAAMGQEAFTGAHFALLPVLHRAVFVRCSAGKSCATDAKEAYGKAAELEPDNVTYHTVRLWSRAQSTGVAACVFMLMMRLHVAQARDAAAKAEDAALAAGSFRFRKKAKAADAKAGGGGGADETTAAAPAADIRKGGARAAVGVRDRTLLSFADDEDGGGEE